MSLRIKQLLEQSSTNLTDIQLAMEDIDFDPYFDDGDVVIEAVLQFGHLTLMTDEQPYTGWYTVETASEFLVDGMRARKLAAAAIYRYEQYADTDTAYTIMQQDGRPNKEHSSAWLYLFRVAVTKNYAKLVEAVLDAIAIPVDLLADVVDIDFDITKNNLPATHKLSSSAYVVALERMQRMRSKDLYLVSSFVSLQVLTAIDAASVMSALLASGDEDDFVFVSSEFAHVVPSMMKRKLAQATIMTLDYLLGALYALTGILPESTRLSVRGDLISLAKKKGMTNDDVARTLEEAAYDTKKYEANRDAINTSTENIARVVSSHGLVNNSEEANVLIAAVEALGVPYVDVKKSIVECLKSRYRHLTQ